MARQAVARLEAGIEESGASVVIGGPADAVRGSGADAPAAPEPDRERPQVPSSGHLARVRVRGEVQGRLARSRWPTTGSASIRSTRPHLPVVRAAPRAGEYPGTGIGLAVCRKIVSATAGRSPRSAPRVRGDLHRELAIRPLPEATPAAEPPGAESRRNRLSTREPQHRRPLTILMADDDPDDRKLTQEAFDEARLLNDLRFVEDGEELLDYLHRRGKYSARAARAGARHHPARPQHAAQGRPRGARRDQGRSRRSADPRRRPDHVQGRGGHRPQLRPGGELVHHQAGHVRRPRRGDAGRWRATGSRSSPCRSISSLAQPAPRVPEHRAGPDQDASSTAPSGSKRRASPLASAPTGRVTSTRLRPAALAR